MLQRQRNTQTYPRFQAINCSVRVSCVSLDNSLAVVRSGYVRTHSRYNASTNTHLENVLFFWIYLLNYYM